MRVMTAMAFVAAMAATVRAETCPQCEQWIADRQWVYEQQLDAEQELINAIGDQAIAVQDLDDAQIQMIQAQNDLAAFRAAQLDYQDEYVSLQQVPESDRDDAWSRRMTWVTNSLGNLSGLIVQAENEAEIWALHMTIASQAISDSISAIAHWEAVITTCQIVIDDLTVQIDGCPH